MVNLQNQHKSFVAIGPVEELLPVQALALVNRWAKLKSYFYHADRDALYALKDRKIAEFVKAGEMKAVAVIVRESQAILGMREAIKNCGKNLEWLDVPVDIHSFLNEEKSTYFSLLHEMLEEEIEVEYPEDIYARWIENIQPLTAEYKVARLQYETEHKRRQTIWEEYQVICNQYQKRKVKAAEEWAKENKITIARSNSGKSYKKDWMRRLEKQGFSYTEKPPINPFSENLACPQAPKIPARTYKVNFENYVPGSLAEVEKALAWCKEIVGDAFPAHSSKIDDFFITFELENQLREIALSKVTEEILAIFTDVVEGRLKNPRDIWEKLTDFDIDYSSAIGMEPYLNFRYGEKSHREFGKWHEINFSSTGYWLVELQSSINPEILFHIPFNSINDLGIRLDFDMLPKIQSDQSKFGREANKNEQTRYPIENLVETLGLSVDDFPYELEKYPRPKYSIHSFGDESWDEDWDDEEN